MTLDGAIKHYKEQAEKYMEYGIETECYQCGKENEQFVEWLTELLQRRERCAQYELEQISNLEQYDMLSREYEILNERYKEAVRLLKLAIEDFKAINPNMLTCRYCKHYNAEIDGCGFPDEDAACENICDWRYADDAKKLLNGQ